SKSIENINTEFNKFVDIMKTIKTLRTKEEVRKSVKERSGIFENIQKMKDELDQLNKSEPQQSHLKDHITKVDEIQLKLVEVNRMMDDWKNYENVIKQYAKVIS